MLALCVLLAWMSVCLRNGHSNVHRMLHRLICAVFLSAYAAGVFWLTLGSRTAKAEPSAKLELFWSYRKSLVFLGDVLSVSDASLFEEIVLNVLLFAPLGAMLAFAWPGRFRGLRGAMLIAVIGACISLAIEVSQWLLRLGLFEFDDVWNNALGAVGGFLAFSVLYALGMRLRDRHGSPRGSDAARGA